MTKDKQILKLKQIVGGYQSIANDMWKSHDGNGNDMCPRWDQELTKLDNQFDKLQQEIQQFNDKETEK